MSTFAAGVRTGQSLVVPLLVNVRAQAVLAVTVALVAGFLLGPNSGSAHSNIRTIGRH